jgi:hypothetical protein
MSTGNWFYDNMMARRQAREMAAALDDASRKLEREHADDLRAGHATPYCSKCGREWEFYFRLRALVWAFGIGAAIGAIGIATLLQHAGPTH